MKQVLFASMLMLLVIEKAWAHEDLLGKIKSGFAYAGKMLGLDRAGNVAQLVSEAFGRAVPLKGDPEEENTIFSGFLRVLGFDTRRIGTMAVNAIIFVAQLISTTLSRPPPAYVTRSRKLQGTPFEWMLDSPAVVSTLTHARDANLPNEIIEYLKEGNPNNNGCILQLICKSAPFVRSMQQALNAKSEEVKKGAEAFTQFLPDMQEVADNGDECEEKFPLCKLHF